VNAIIKYRAGYRYQLAETYRVAIPFWPGRGVTTEWISFLAPGELTINAGYAWDGPSGPALDTSSAMRGSLIHDALYQMIRLGHLAPGFRAAADRIYEEMCIEDGMWPPRAWAHFRALRWFGREAAKPSSEPQVLTAP